MTAVDQLSVLLREAKRYPDRRPAFYRALWGAELCVPGESAGQTGGEEGEVEYRLSFYEVKSKWALPCFSSEEIFLQVMPVDQPLIRLRGQDLVQNVPSEMELVLNPGTDQWKSFTRFELRALKAGVLFERYQRPERLEGERILIGAAKESPEELVNLLRERLNELEDVARAYLAQVFVPSVKLPPHPLIGLELISSPSYSFAEIVLDLHLFLWEQSQDADAVDFHEMMAEEPDELTRHLLQGITPFYEKEGGNECC